MTEKAKPDDNTQVANKQPAVNKPADRTVFRRQDAASGQDPGGIKRTNRDDARDTTRIAPGQQPVARPSSGPARQETTQLRNQRHVQNHSTRVRPQQAHGNRAGQSADPGNTRVPARQQPPVNTHRASPGRGQHQVLKGRFTLEKVIGVGGMGVVYKATDRLKVEARDREPFVAIKVLSEEFKSHPESFIALQRESRKTQRIAHPNVVKVYDFDRDGDTVFMTMEYMEGVPLDQLIKQYSSTGLPREEAWNILKGLCSALIHAHAENIVHSDFKPGNIFVTDTGIAKIFDFGIARAVANVDRQTGKLKDRTVFDAGSLGALTPAYASLEMLQGQQPDVRDDVYALGCIAYEMLTGEHPFNRIPADEACNSKLKPRKISNIKKRQWKAIEKALQFKREDRAKSVEEFYSLIQPKTRQASIVVSTLVVLIAIVTATVLIVTHESAQQAQPAIQVDEIEFKIRYDLFKEKLTKLINDPSFTGEWEDSVWEEMTGLAALLRGKPDNWYTTTRGRIYVLYVNKYKALLEKTDYARAGQLLENAHRYTDDPRLLDSEKKKLAELISRQKEKEKALAEAKRNRQEQQDRQTRQTANNNYMFDLALKNVNQQLQCQARLNMREFSVAVDKLRSIDMRRYAKLEDNLVVTLAECINHIGKTQPERAMEDKNYALRIFRDNRVISAINIAPRDACNISIAGLGARGERAVCRDKITGHSDDGPALVVIPGNGSIRPFAIGKYEVSRRDINIFCRITGQCMPNEQGNSALPAVEIDAGLARSYLTWLSRVTKQKYRLPTKQEWIYAANAKNHFVDPNRNCALNTRGIEKGGQLVRANTGVQNSWGLVNYLGNAREWVYDKSRNLIAIGGSFQDSMSSCTVGSFVRHSGRADAKTGFRVVREVSR